ncbi:MAG TPA: hypothetical protein VIS48_13465 [Candidatus Kryptonia bacterium]
MHQRQQVIFFAAAFSCSIILVAGCSSNRVARSTYQVLESGKITESSKFLKVHMMNGDVYVLENWKVNEESREVYGKGRLFDPYRALVKQDSFAIPLGDVALFESNVVSSSGPLMAMCIVTGVSAALTVFCLTHPKACFGSCPTFYVWDGKRMKVQAEAFSASVTPSFEATDIDALYMAKPVNRNLEVVLTNEAMETHVIKFAHILLAPRSRGARVFVTPSGEFFESKERIAPQSAVADEGDCLQQISAADGIERCSAADSNDLAAKESIYLTFNRAPSSEAGLVIGYRQTLLTTYLFYQALAFMGNSSGYLVADLQRQNSDYVTKAKTLFWGAIGGIDVMVRGNDGAWEKAGEVSEIGPIATNFELVPLPRLTSGQVKIRLVMTKGLWRIDYVALAGLDKRVEPVTIQPLAVIRGDSTNDDVAKESLSGSGTSLVTMPGDKYSIIYRMPEDYENYEIFLQARGYYLEWVRKEWLAEEDPSMTLTMFSDPGRYLKILAPRFKKVEPFMEQSFWRSKYVEH